MTDNTPRIELTNLLLGESEAPEGRIPRGRVVIDRVNLAIPCDRYFLVGEEADRRCFIDLLVGRRNPTEGRLRRRGRCSYPVGRTGPFAVAVTGADMVQFLADSYSFDAQGALAHLRSILPWPSVLTTRLDRASQAQRLSLSIAMLEYLRADIVVIDGSLLNPEFPADFLQHMAVKLPEMIAGRLAVISTRQAAVLQPLAAKSLIISHGQMAIADEIVPVSTRLLPAAGETIGRAPDDPAYDEVL